MTQGMIDTGTDHLLANLTGGVFTLTFNRPEARNALSGDLLQALGAQLSDAEINPDVRCVVVTGSGNAFCAGGAGKAMSFAVPMLKSPPLRLKRRLHVYCARCYARLQGSCHLRPMDRISEAIG